MYRFRNDHDGGRLRAPYPGPLRCYARSAPWEDYPAIAMLLLQNVAPVRPDAAIGSNQAWLQFVSVQPISQGAEAEACSPAVMD